MSTGSSFPYRSTVAASSEPVPSTPPVSPEPPASPLAGLVDLISKAETEIIDVMNSDATAVAIKNELDDVRVFLEEKQKALDEARAAVSAERVEAIAALRAVADAITNEIRKLEATA